MNDTLTEVVIPLAVMTPAVAVAASVPLFGPASVYAAVVALVAAVAVASPLLALWLRRGHTRWWEIAGLGCAAGAFCILLPTVALAVWDGHGIAGTVDVMFTLLTAAIGTATGAAYWLLFLRNEDSRRSSVAAAAAMCLFAVSASYVQASWPAQTWPRYSEQHERLAFSWDFGAATDELGTREVRLWSAAKPQCVVSVYLPELTAGLQSEPPTSIDVEITRIREDWGRRKHTRVDSVQAVQLPRGPLTFLQGCQSWLAPR